MREVSSEQKLQLVKTIREENRMNRSRMRTREHILYGGDTVAMPKQSYYDELGQEAPVPVRFSSIKLRFLLALLLFIAFLTLDLGQSEIAGIGGKQIHDAINQTFDLNMFDFMEDFPYTLTNALTEG